MQLNFFKKGALVVTGKNDGEDQNQTALSVLNTELCNDSGRLNGGEDDDNYKDIVFMEVYILLNKCTIKQERRKGKRLFVGV